MARTNGRDARLHRRRPLRGGGARRQHPLSTRVPADDVAALERAVDGTVAAVILEPVQGLSGARDLSRDFLLAARRACDAQARR